MYTGVRTVASVGKSRLLRPVGRSRRGRRSERFSIANRSEDDRCQFGASRVFCLVLAAMVRPSQGRSFCESRLITPPSQVPRSNVRILPRLATNGRLRALLVGDGADVSVDPQLFGPGSNVVSRESGRVGECHDLATRHGQQHLGFGYTGHTAMGTRRCCRLSVSRQRSLGGPVLDAGDSPEYSLRRPVPVAITKSRGQLIKVVQGERPRRSSSARDCPGVIRRCILSGHTAGGSNGLEAKTLQSFAWSNSLWPVRPIVTARKG